MKNELLSVIIPVYNTSKSLDACLNSVLRQDYSNLEIICIDDGSEDNSLDILKNFASKDSRIRIIQHKTNKGLLSARRSGVEAAQGDYIQFLDSDDTVDFGLFSTAIEAMRSNNVDIVQFPARLTFLNSKKKDYMNPPLEKYTDKQILENFFVSMKVSTSLVVKIYKTEICKKAFIVIPDIRCYVGEDILTSFFIAYYASSYLGVKTRAKYNYYFGSGISSETKMPLNKFQLYCEMNRFPEIIKTFLKDKPDNSLDEMSLKYLTFRLVSDCLINYSLVNNSDREEAGNLFWESWKDNPYFSKAILYAVDNQANTINEIKNSESYIIGNSIINPLHNVRVALSSLKTS